MAEGETVVDDEELLLSLLNSAPVVDGRPTDELEGGTGREFAARWGGTGSDAELQSLRRARGALHALVRDTDSSAELDRLLGGVVRVPEVTAEGVRWGLRTPDDRRLAVRAVLAWSAVRQQLPGRLRACGNDECNLFLIDHSRPGTAKWCSMATCGNRMKARAHAARARSAS